MKEEAVEKMEMGDVLKARLKSNEPVLEHLPEAFALLASSLPLPLLLVDPAPIIKHAIQVSNQACWIAHSDARELSWYTRRASISAIYLAAELHQLTSPKTAPAFLDSLLENAEHAGKALDETALFASYVWKSWRGIVRSSGVLV
jgi:ubiquinone biosynthesis protein COQ9